jgi:hypothetical protein
MPIGYKDFVQWQVGTIFAKLPDHTTRYAAICPLQDRVLIPVACTTLVPINATGQLSRRVGSMEDGGKAEVFVAALVATRAEIG